MGFLGKGDELGGDGVGDVDLIVPEHAALRVVVRDGQEADAVQGDRLGVPVVGVALHLEVVVGAPFLQFEGAVGDDVAGLGPGGGEGGVDLPVLQHHVAGHREPGEVLRNLGQERHLSPHVEH